MIILSVPISLHKTQKLLLKNKLKIKQTDLNGSAKLNFRKKMFIAILSIIYAPIKSYSKALCVPVIYLFYCFWLLINYLRKTQQIFTNCRLFAVETSSKTRSLGHFPYSLTPSSHLSFWVFSENKHDVF